MYGGCSHQTSVILILKEKLPFVKEQPSEFREGWVNCNPSINDLVFHTSCWFLRSLSLPIKGPLSII